jgi:hypothetical protein
MIESPILMPSVLGLKSGSKMRGAIEPGRSSTAWDAAIAVDTERSTSLGAQTPESAGFADIITTYLARSLGRHSAFSAATIQRARTQDQSGPYSPGTKA